MNNNYTNERIQNVLEFLAYNNWRKTKEGPSVVKESMEHINAILNGPVEEFAHMLKNSFSLPSDIKIEVDKNIVKFVYESKMFNKKETINFDTALGTFTSYYGGFVDRIGNINKDIDKYNESLENPIEKFVDEHGFNVTRVNTIPNIRMDKFNLFEEEVYSTYNNVFGSLEKHIDLEDNYGRD